MSLGESQFCNFQTLKTTTKTNVKLVLFKQASGAWSNNYRYLPCYCLPPPACLHLWEVWVGLGAAPCSRVAAPSPEGLAQHQPVLCEVYRPVQKDESALVPLLFMPPAEVHVLS